MVLAKFGKKRQCFQCSIKFYDLNKKSQLICPSCGFENTFNDFEHLPFDKKNQDYYNNKKINDNNHSKSEQLEDVSFSDEELNPIEEVDNDEVISLEEAEKDQESR